jgi:hypothetical protein
VDYNLIFHRPATDGVCDVCGGRLVARADDTPEAVEGRLRDYHEKTRPVLELFGAKEVIVAVDATGRWNRSRLPSASGWGSRRPPLDGSRLMTFLHLRCQSPLSRIQDGHAGAHAMEWRQVESWQQSASDQASHRLTVHCVASTSSAC